MKKNMKDTMDRLEIDSGIRGLVRQMWKHCYRTKGSCEGDNEEERAYILFSTEEGDGWFEENHQKYGLFKKENNDCCYKEISKIEQEMREQGFDPEKMEIKNKSCGECGAGINGNVIYEGKLIPEPFTPENFKTHKS